jgi:NitT/TauT family transport system permease protein
VKLLFTFELWGHILASLEIIFVGFILSVLIAVPVGIMMGYYSRVNSTMRNFIELIRPISPLALYPLFIFIFGIGFMSKLAIVFWVSWIPLLFNTISGVKKTNEHYLHMAKILGATNMQIITNIILPAILPWVITGMRLAMGSALLVIVAAEMIGSNHGIGFFILNASYTFKIVDLYSGILVIAIIGIIINKVFSSLEKASKIYYD